MMMSLRLLFNDQTGVWSGFIQDSRALASAPSVDVQVHSTPVPFPQPSDWQMRSVQRRGEVTEVVRQAGGWQVRQRFRLVGSRLERDVVVRWDGAGAVKIAGVYLRTPVLRLSGSASEWWLIPGDFPIHRVPASEWKPGRTTEERGWTHAEYEIAILHAPQSRLSVIAGYVFQVDQARVGVEEHAQGVVLRHRFETLAKLEPGQELAIGTQVIEVVQGDASQILPHLARFSDSLGNGPPADVPAHLKGAVLYELHPWGRLESWWAGDRGNRFARLTAQLPFLRALGVTTLWLLPPGHPPPWVYTTLGFNRVAPENGSPQELKEFVQQAHRLGMKVAVDLVVYGLHPDSEEVKGLPEDVWCVDEQGRRVKVWGGTILSADVSHPVWQERIRTIVTRWAKEYGFDGARLDVAGWGQSPNWRNPLRANASVAYGGLRLNRVVRSAFRAVTRHGFILPEAGKPLAFRHADLLYDYPWYMLLREVTLQPDLARWIREAREWLEWERHCYPRGAHNGLLRFLENHDTVSAGQFWGVGMAQALMAICCLMQGVPLVYQEQEIGFADEVAKWLHLRRRERCLAEGEAEYLSVQCSHPHVFTFLRRADDGAAVVAVNLTGERVRCRLSWRKAVSQRFPVCADAFSGEIVQATGGRAEVSIAPYRPVVLLLKPRGWRAASKHIAKRKVTQASGARWRVLEDGSVCAFGAQRWFVETLEGTLEDAFRDYGVRVKPSEALVDGLPVLKRAWNSLEEGLLDGSERASMGVRWGDGQELRLNVDPARATEVRIVDERLDGKKVFLIIKPREAYTIGQSVPTIARRGQIEVTPLFVVLASGQSAVSLSRRHGGLLVGWRAKDGKQLCFVGGDAYTDWGLVEGGYASADGETNPRLQVTDNGTAVRFTGWLRHRAWNGVQSCPIASPGTRYWLSYLLDAQDGLRVGLGIVPLAERGERRAFFALRLPVRGVIGWQRGAEGGRAGERTGVRLGESRVDNAPPLVIRAEQGVLTVSEARGFQNVFLIDSGNGEATLFLALLDGAPVALRAGAERSAEVFLRWER